MCLAVPGEIMEITGSMARIRVMGIETMVNIELIENPEAGDYVLVHAGCAIEKVNQDYFNELELMFQRILDEDEQNG